MATTVDVVKGSADEEILRKQYGDKVAFNYTNANQYGGADRFSTNQMYQQALGAPVNDAGDLNQYNGVKLETGGYLKPQSQDYSTAAQMEQLKQAQIKAAMAALDKQRNSSLSNLTAERATIEPEYQKQKMQAGVTARQTARSFDEYMAQRGGNRSGIAGQGTLMNNMAYQGQVGALNQGEASAISDNARRVTDVNNAYQSDVAAANAGAEASYLQNYINQMNADRTFNQNDLQANRSHGLQALSAKQQQDAQLWEQQFKEKGFSADEAYRMAQLKMQQEQAAADNQYRYAALNRSSSGGGSGGSEGSGSTVKYSDSSTLSMKNKLDSALANGATVDELISELDGFIEDGSAKLGKYDIDYLKSYLEGKRPASAPQQIRVPTALEFYQKWR